MSVRWWSNYPLITYYEDNSLIKFWYKIITGWCTRKKDEPQVSWAFYVGSENREKLSGVIILKPGAIHVIGKQFQVAVVSHGIWGLIVAHCHRGKLFSLTPRVRKDHFQLCECLQQHNYEHKNEEKKTTLTTELILYYVTVGHFSTSSSPYFCTSLFIELLWCALYFIIYVIIQEDIRRYLGFYSLWLILIKMKKFTSFFGFCFIFL